MTRVVCDLCGCVFGSLADLRCHIDAHRRYGDDLPCVKNRKSRTVSELIVAYIAGLRGNGVWIQDRIACGSGVGRVVDYWSPEWVALSERVVVERHNRCDVCGASYRLECQHIYPGRRLFLDKRNLVVLCQRCRLRVHKGINKELSMDWLGCVIPAGDVGGSDVWRRCVVCGRIMYGRYPRCYECYKRCVEAVEQVAPGGGRGRCV
jgi:hypothetical protein